MKRPALRDLLWRAQRGCCWICGGVMRKALLAHPDMATLDHIWPKAIFGAVGDVGTTLLAHQLCNGKRGSVVPNDDEIRILISIYREIPKQWLLRVAKDAEGFSAKARAMEVRRDLCLTLAGNGAGL